MLQKIERRYLPLFPGVEKIPSGDRTRTPSPREGKDRRVEEKKNTEGKNHKGQRRHNILFTERVLNRNIGKTGQEKKVSGPLDVNGDALH